jgi:hypothetical protein
MQKSKLTKEEYKRAWTNPLGLALLTYYLVMAVIGLLIPDNILSNYTWARDFSDFMASVVPQIDRITALDIKPDINRFYFSVLWAGSPISFFICSWLVFNGRKQNHAIWTMPFSQAWYRIVIIVLAIVCAYFLWSVNPTSRLIKTMLLNGFGRGFYAQIIFNLGMVFFLAALAIWIHGWLTGYIPRNIKAQNLKKQQRG